MAQPHITNSATEKLQFLTGGGEMGGLMRSLDWSQTLAGTPDTWPQSLRTTLNIILQSKFPMFLWWGPALVCFYNDAYRPSLGENGKHPAILGQPANEAWPEIWDTIQPLIEQVLAGGDAIWREDQLIPIFRNGKMEDVYWTFSYSPVHNEQDNVAGVLVTCSETTEKIRVLNAIKDREDQLSFTINAAGLATWDLDPFTNRFTGNERIKEWFGLTPDAEIDLALALNCIVETDRQTVIDAIQAALQPGSDGNYEVEYTIVNPVNNRERKVLAKGKAVFNSNNMGYRFSGILEDITEQVTALHQIEESEKEFRQLADSLPELVWTTNSKGKQIFASRRWREFTGLDPFDENTFTKMVHPDDLENVIKVWTDCLATGKIYKTQLRLKSKSGEYFWFYANGEPIKNGQGEIEKWVGAFTNLNEQKKAEQELIGALLQVEESEIRFRNVANNAPVLIWMSDTDKHRHFFNTAWLNFTGRTVVQEDGYGWAESISPDHFERCLNTYKDAFDKREEFYLEYCLKRHDGEYRWVSDHGVPRFTSDGVFEGYIGACMDIHERVIYQKKLKEDEERLNIVIEASELATWELNLQNNEFDSSSRLLEIFGNTKPLADHSEILKQVHPEDLQIRALAFTEAYTTGILHYVSRIVWPDKSVHWIENKGKIFYDEDNKPMKLIGTSRDITEEKSYQQRLEEREQKFRLLADSMPQFVWTGDAEGNLNYFSRSVYDYSGLTTEQIDKDGWLQIVHPDDKEENIKAWINSVATGTDFIFEHRFGRHDGEYRWQLSRAIPQRDAAGNIQMWVGTSTDIQEIKELDQQKDFFISMASHELKTPITSIKGYVQMLQSMYVKSEDKFLKNSLQVIDKQIITLTNLISDLLDLSKIKSGSLILNRENFKLNELVEEVINEIKQISPGYSISFLKQGETIVNADRGRIGQVLINFLTNAIKYSPNSKAVKVEAAVAGSNVQVSVEDSGIGINKNDQEKIFERFYRVEGKNEKTFPGFGIGLFIASEIIRRHNGNIDVKSEPGKGSIFYFSIPFTD